MTNRPAQPNEPHRDEVPTNFDPAYQGNGDYNDFGVEDIPASSHASANTPAIRDESAHDSADHAIPEVSPKEKASAASSTKTLAGGTWVALIIGALLLILLLVFIMQNQTSVELNLFAWSFQFPAGIGFLLAAITGALIMALVGGVRMFEYRRQIKKLRKTL